MSLLNRIINKIPFEAHIPGYSFCGPGTKLEKRLNRGDLGKNALDRACKDHDIAYSQSTEVKDRHIADRKLVDRAWERVKASDSSIGEKIAAWGVTNALKAKLKLGMGHCKKRNHKKGFRNAMKAKRKQRKHHSKKRNNKKSFRALVSQTKNDIKHLKPATTADTIRIALKAAQKIKDRKNVKTPRVIPLNFKIGGFLPLIPIFAGLSAIGALSGGAAGIASAVNKAKEAKQELDEMKRHNRTIESIAIGKGLYLAPYKKGSGLYLKPWGKGK